MIWMELEIRVQGDSVRVSARGSRGERAREHEHVARTAAGEQRIELVAARLAARVVEAGPAPVVALGELVLFERGDPAIGGAAEAEADAHQRDPGDAEARQCCPRGGEAAALSTGRAGHPPPWRNPRLRSWKNSKRTRSSARSPVRMTPATLT